ncbi:hypothetical protein JTB14_025660 [Gonioctena quinquepunctata]|nr:hypothetical protein JTB14_025660 [Gonioctena quinquepunctata]
MLGKLTFCNSLQDNVLVLLIIRLSDYDQQIYLLKVTLASDPLTHNSIHHYALKLELSCITDNVGFNKYEEFYYDFKNGDYIGLNNNLASADWESIFGSKDSIDIKEITERFDVLIHTAITCFVPLKRFKSSNLSKWLNAELRDLVIKRRKAHKPFIGFKEGQDYLSF